MTKTLKMLALAVVMLLIVLLLAWQLALRQIQSHLRTALGPRASIGSVQLGWTGLTLHDLVIRAAPGWPAAEELRAGQVEVVPSLGSLLGGMRRGEWGLSRITVRDASLSMLRGRDGRMRLLPALLADPAATSKAAGTASGTATDKPTGTTAASASSAPPVGPASPTHPARQHLAIGRVELEGVQIDFYDASLPGWPAKAPPHHLQLAELQVSAEDIQLPELDRPIRLKLDGLLRGHASEKQGPDAHAQAQDGHIAIQGLWTPAGHDADIQARLKGIDLRVLQPYLMKVAESGIRRGTLDLTLDAQVVDQRLKAPGQLTLTGLELAEGAGWWDQLGGASRQAVLATLSDKGAIVIKFTLEGRLDDPQFSLNDSLARRFAAGLAESVGVSVGGVVKGVGQVIKGLFGK